jgi:hypothetical protein
MSQWTNDEHGFLLEMAGIRIIDNGERHYPAVTY